MRRVPGLRSVLAGRDFRRLYATRLISQSGDGLFQVALAAYAFFDPQSQPTAPAVAGAFAALLLPYSLVGPWAGVFLDRWRRRQVLARANLVRGALVLAMAGVVLLDAPLPVLLGLGLAVVSVNRFFLAALSAALPHVVERRYLVTANSLSTTSGTIAAFLGGGVGYGLRVVIGPDAGGTAGLLAAVTVWYLCSSLTALTIPRDLLGPDIDPTRPDTRTALRDVAVGLAAGARHAWQRRTAGHGLAVIAAHRFFYGVNLISVLLLYRNYFHADELAAGLGGLALTLGATGVGYFAAALVTPYATRRLRKQTWVTTMLVGGGAAQLALGAPYVEELVVVAAFCLGVAGQGLKICVDTLVQESVDDAYRGRVFSFYDVVFNVFFVAAAAVGAVALPATGKSYVMLAVVAGGFALSGAWYGLRTKALRRRAPDPTGVLSTEGPR